MLGVAWYAGFRMDGPRRPRSAFFQSVVDATGVSRERVLITTHRAVLASLGFAKSFPMKCFVLLWCTCSALLCPFWVLSYNRIVLIHIWRLDHYLERYPFGKTYFGSMSNNWNVSYQNFISCLVFVPILFKVLRFDFIWTRSTRSLPWGVPLIGTCLPIVTIEYTI